MLDTQSNASISMTALYRSLRTIGLTRSTVRNTLLPDYQSVAGFGAQTIRAEILAKRQ